MVLVCLRVDWGTTRVEKIVKNVAVTVRHVRPRLVAHHASFHTSFLENIVSEIADQDIMPNQTPEFVSTAQLTALNASPQTPV